MRQRQLSFGFTRSFEDFICLGGEESSAALCTSSPLVLFDPGVSVFGPLCLKEVQARTEGSAGLVIALSHAHFDHCGAAAYLMRKIPAARLVASERSANILQRPNAVELIIRLSCEYEQGMQDELAGEDVSFEPLTVTDRLKDGDRIELDNGRVCRVLETPGHTRDSLSYYFPDTGIAFVGEAAGVLEQGFLHSPYLVSYEDYIASIAKIRDLHPRAVCMAHGGILAGEEVDRYLVEAAAAAVAYKDMIRDYLEFYDGDQERVVERITREEYDTQQGHIQKREPYILNLRAKVNTVVAWLAGQKRV